MKGAEAILDKWDRLFEELKKVIDELIPELEKSSEEIKTQYAEISEELKEIRAAFAELSGRVTQLELESKSAPRPEMDEGLKKRLEGLELEVSKLSKRLDSVERLVKDRIHMYDEELKKVRETVKEEISKSIAEIPALSLNEEIEKNVEKIEKRLEELEKKIETVERREVAGEETLVERVADRVIEKISESVSRELAKSSEELEEKLKMEVSRLEKEISALKSEVQVNRKKIFSLSEKFDEFVPFVEKKSAERKADSKSPRLL